MRSENQTPWNSKNLLDFRRMTMRCNAVRFKVLVGEAEMRARVGLLAGSGYTRNRVNDDGSALGRKPQAECGGGSKRSLRRIASRSANYHAGTAFMVFSSFGKILAEKLGKTECRSLEQIGLRMGNLVPLFIDGRIL